MDEDSRLNQSLQGAARSELKYIELWCNDKFDEYVLRREVDAVTQATGRLFPGSFYQDYDRLQISSSHWILRIDFN